MPGINEDKPSSVEDKPVPENKPKTFYCYKCKVDRGIQDSHIPLECLKSCEVGISFCKLCINPNDDTCVVVII
jgi:hypothetical protein